MKQACSFESRLLSIGKRFSHQLCFAKILKDNNCNTRKISFLLDTETHKASNQKYFL